MLVISFVQWWYGRGFKEFLAKFVDHLKDVADFFSIRLLVRHLFAPFRQIATEKKTNLPMSERIHAWADLMISRLVGATIRFVLLIVGTVFLLIRFILGVIVMILWPLAPVAMVAAALLYLKGVVL